MSTGRTLLISLLCLSAAFYSAQEVKAVYKTDELLRRVKRGDTTYVVSFWATWCKPCMEELPSIDSLHRQLTDKRTKVLLVSLDFREQLSGKVNAALRAKGINAECVLLDEVNGNEFINKFSPDWSGAIPTTFFIKGSKTAFYEKKLGLKQLRANLAAFKK